MQITQKNDLQALDNVLYCLSQNTASVALLPLATPCITTISTNIGSMYAIDTELQSLYKQSVSSKNLLKKTLYGAVYQSAAKGRAYASNTNQVNLEQILTTKITTLIKMSDIILRDYAQMIHQTLTAELANIDAVYGITPALLTALQGHIDAFTAVIPGAGSRLSHIKNLNQTFATLLTDTKAVAKKLDILVETIRFTQTTFYAAYHAARKPKKVATKPRALVFMVLDATTNLPLYRANVTFTAQKTNKTIALTTNKNGKIVIQNMAEDIYEGTVSETSYISADYTIPILDGKTFHKTILLTQDPTANRNARS